MNKGDASLRSRPRRNKSQTEGAWRWLLEIFLKNSSASAVYFKKAASLKPFAFLKPFIGKGFRAER
jgi:hypothetical protein